MRGASSWDLPFVLLKLKRPDLLAANCRAAASTVIRRLIAATKTTATLATVQIRRGATVDIVVPGIVADGSPYFASFVSSPDHSTVVINMTNLNQIDKDLKALRSDMVSYFVAVGRDIADVSKDVKAISAKLDDLSGGPSDDETQATIDELTAKLKEQEAKLKAVLSPDQ